MTNAGTKLRMRLKGFCSFRPQLRSRYSSSEPTDRCCELIDTDGECVEGWLLDTITRQMVPQRQDQV